MIKFLVAAVWICALTVGASVYSFRSATERPDAPPPAPLLGGLDYIKTEMVSVPVLHDGVIEGYFLSRLVYTVEPREIARLSVPPETLLMDEVYSYVFANVALDFRRADKIDLDTFRSGLRDSINKRVGKEIIHEVMIEQVDFLSKDEIRDNAIRRRLAAGATAREMAKPFKAESSSH